MFRFFIRGDSTVFFNDEEIKQIKECLTRANSINVLCIGDIMLDQFVYGSVTRISPEAPVPVFLKKSDKTMLGGAGNVALNVSSLGCNTTFLGVVGSDKNATTLSKLFKAANIKNYFFKIRGLATTVKTRIIANNQHLLRIDNEEPYQVPLPIIPRLTTLLKKLITSQNIVLLSDYNKGIFSVESCQTVINLCNQMNKRVIVDPKGSDYEKYRNAYLVKPNLKEFSLATGISSIDPTSDKFFDQIKSGSFYLFDKYNIKNLVITLSEYGMVYVSQEKEQIYHVPTVAKEVFDVSGAGDTSLATLGLALASGIDIRTAVSLANVASGLVVAKLGTASVSMDELLQNISIYNS